MTPARWRQLESLYNQAVELDETRRSAFLSEACVGDDELQHDLEELFAQDPQAASFLEKTALREIAHEFAATAGLDWVGRHVGKYQFETLMGAGGMGEVYRARDTELKRDVAIKVLLDEFSHDQSRISRFQHEAQLLASLNHPNIAAIYDLEEADGHRFLILELVEGETLADRIKHGPIPAEEALKVALQIAEALEAAHEKSVIHRDLKPANIKITSNGKVKVLDFGLAKALHGDVDVNQSNAPTRSITETQDGVILGTPGYMSPEQARGQLMDARTDLWSLGVILYEMATGVRPFDGPTSAVIFEALLGKTPTSVREQSPKVSLEMEQIIDRLLEKDREMRYQSAAAVRADLQRLQQESSFGAAAATPESRRPTYRAARLIVMALLLLTVVAGLVYLAKPTGPVTSSAEYTKLTNFTDSAVAPSFSPDGRMVAFKRGPDAFLSRGEIYVKQLPDGEPVQLTNSRGAKYGPVFTPDSSRIAYTHFSAPPGEPYLWDTWTVPVSGRGEPTRFLPNASGLTWIGGRRVLFAEVMGTGLHMGIVTDTESRAERREIYFPPGEVAMAHFAYLSPDRQSVLVVEMDQSHEFSQPCRLLPFDGSSEGRQVGPSGTCTAAGWSPDGKWMYFSVAVGGSSHIWRQKFSSGAPEQITFGPYEEEGIAVAPDGQSLVTSIGTRRSAIWLHDPAADRAIVAEGYAGAPRFSRNETKVFYLLARNLGLSSSAGWAASSSELRSIDLASRASDSPLPGMSIKDYDISSDEKEVAFTRTERGLEPEIWLASLDRSAPPRRIAKNGDQVSFGADGDLVFRSLEDNTLFRINRAGGMSERISPLRVTQKYGVSPDGGWAIIWSPAAGKNAAATLAVPTYGGTPRKICDNMCPSLWSLDGRFLYIRRGKTFAIPIPVGKSLPDLPAKGTGTVEELAKRPGVLVLEQDQVFPGPNPATYTFLKTEQQRNLYRIPLH